MAPLMKGWSGEVMPSVDGLNAFLRSLGRCCLANPTNGSGFVREGVEDVIMA